MAAVVHRLNGGLNNAAMAYELAVADQSSPGTHAGRTLTTGLAGFEQAQRALALLLELLSPPLATSPALPGPYLDDVFDMLRAHAARRSLDLRYGGDEALHDVIVTPGVAATCLLEGLAALGAATPGIGLEMRPSAASVATQPSYVISAVPAIGRDCAGSAGRPG